MGKGALACFKEALELRGYKQVSSARDEHQRKHPYSRKYITMYKEGKEEYVFLGTHGAVRVGKTVSSSHGLSDGAKVRLLETLVKHREKSKGETTEVS